jgi:hypothetical protein
LTGQTLESILSAAVSSGLDREGFDYVLYTWWWTDDELKRASEIFKGKRATVLGRTSQGLPQEYNGKIPGTVFDQSLGVRGTGDGFKRQLDFGCEQGWAVADMTPFGHCFEYYWQPYTPAPKLVAEKLVSLRELGSSGWFDYDCGGIYPGINAEVIREDHQRPQDDAEQLALDTLRRLFPAAEVSSAQQAYETAEAALRLRPIAYDAPDSVNMSGRAMFELSIALPFSPSDFSGLDNGHRIFWFAPQNFMTPGAIETLVGMLGDCHRAWLQACERIQRLKGQGAWVADLEWEKRVFRAHALVSGSAWRYAQVAKLRLRRGADLDAAGERDALLPLLQDELAAAEEFAAMWRKDRRLLMNAFFREHAVLQTINPWRPIDRDDPFVTKIAHTRTLIERVKNGPWDAVPKWAGQ